MIHKMPGQLHSQKPRKRKISSEVKSSRKAAAARRRCTRSPRTRSAAESAPAAGGGGKAAEPPERLSRISCECHQPAGRRRCSASPELQGQEGKENELGPGPGPDSGPDSDSCGVNGPSDMDCEESSNMFPDDDSNQILPVEQFFGNMDAVQDFPQRSSATSAHVQRANRRRYYYAREDSEEEEEEGGVQRDDRGGS